MLLVPPVGALKFDLKSMPPSVLETLWKDYSFTPNDAQRQAILHLDGPLYLPAGPGSGKTRVLLWRCVNLIVIHDIAPEQIFLSTFTEKAARQLKEGMRALLGAATNLTGKPYDVERMFVGTVHSLCQRLLAERRFTGGAFARRPPTLLDDLAQYLNLYQARRWSAFWDGHWSGGDQRALHQHLQKTFAARGTSKHMGVSSCISFFNRLSEECFDAQGALDAAERGEITLDADMTLLLGAYERYKADLAAVPARTDFALIQQDALRTVQEFSAVTHQAPFEYVIVDEYQDTNTVQERLYFALAGGKANLCVVGDDDQALYRFRGATVENFVQFPARCQSVWGRDPLTITLSTNYRSRSEIVRAYKDFMEHTDWSQGQNPSFFRVDKNIAAHSSDQGPAVVASALGDGETIAQEIALFTKKLLDEGRVQDPSQIAFLFPSVKSAQAEKMAKALTDVGLKVYAPRAKPFVYVEEATILFGLFAHVFGKPKRGSYGSAGGDYDEFYKWIDDAFARAGALLKANAELKGFIETCQSEVKQAVSDETLLLAVLERQGWNVDDFYEPAKHKHPLVGTRGISDSARTSLQSGHFDRIVSKRIREGAPFRLGFVLRRATVLDWNLLDLFYQLCGFPPLLTAFELAEKPVGKGRDEGPICNLSLLSGYLGRFAESYANVLTAGFLRDDNLVKALFGSYLYALFQRGEGEFEDEDDPFPQGRIPFLTIHQSKGLEFPVVVLGSGYKKTEVQRLETLVRPLLPASQGREPLDRMADFDAMRLFYVALSRAQNLLVLPNQKNHATRFKPLNQFLEATAPPLLSAFDVQTIPQFALHKEKLPQNYSFTGDFLSFKRCARQYMIFRHYDFTPAHSQTMMFGSLVHNTVEDLHNLLIQRRAAQGAGDSTHGANTHGAATNGASNSGGGA